MSCLVEEELRALCDGSLAEDVAARFFAHVENCRTCENSLNAIEQASSDRFVKELVRVARNQPFCEEFGYRTALWIIQNKTLPQALESPAARAESPPALRQRITRCPFDLTAELTLVRHVSSGGAGNVFEAVHRPSGRRCAVKILNQEHLHPASRQRFEREIRLLQALEHPHIVRLWDYGVWEGCPYLVTEYVDAESLAVRVRRDGPLPLESAIELMMQVAIALQYAHERSIVHRDLTPANILLDGQGATKIIDLGLAKALAGEHVDDDGLTPRGIGAGTLAYMAPEQAEGLHKADERSDVYSFAATLCFLLTGSADRSWLVDAPEANVLDALTLGKSLPAELRRWLRRMLASNPQDRTQTMAAVTRELSVFGLR